MKRRGPSLKGCPRTVKGSHLRATIGNMDQVRAVEGQRLGDLNTATLEIELSPELRRSNVASVLTHEIAHFLVYEADLEIDGDLEEKLVAGLTPSLACLIRDNQRLLAWIRERLRE